MQDGSVSPVRNFFRNSSVWGKTALALFFVLITVAIILAITSVITTQEKNETNVYITNLPESSNMPKSYKIDTEKRIWQLVEQNEASPTSEKYQAIVREDSYHEEVDQNMFNADFIVDIEELQYSFEIDISWPRNEKKIDDSEPSINIRCPYYIYTIYPTQCIAESPIAQIRRYLPQNYYLDDEHLIKIAESSIGNNFRLLVYIHACKNRDLLDSAVDSARNWIQNTLYLDSSAFNMEAYDTCL